MNYRRPPRLARFDYRGRYRYSLTSCTFERHACFLRADVVVAARSAILHTLHERDFEELAYVFMPDHMHLLLEGVSRTADLKSTMKAARMRSTVAVRPLVAMPSLWQDGYWDRVLRRDEDVVAVADYIVQNPVRAGLVQRPEDYPYVFSRYHETLKRNCS